MFSHISICASAFLRWLEVLPKKTRILSEFLCSSRQSGPGLSQSSCAPRDSMPKSKAFWSPRRWQAKNEEIRASCPDYVILKDKPGEGYQEPFCVLCKQWATEEHLVSKGHTGLIEWKNACEKCCKDPYVDMQDRYGSDWQEPWCELCKGWVQDPNTHLLNNRHTSALNKLKWETDQEKPSPSEHEPPQTQSQRTPLPLQPITASPKGAPFAASTTASPAPAEMPKTIEELRNLLHEAYLAGLAAGSESQKRPEDDRPRQ